MLATFGLSEGGWDAFCQNFQNEKTAESVLTSHVMAPHCAEPWHNGHAVVLIGCAPQSLTFLNSWGSDWGKNGTFSIEDYTVLSIEDEPMRFYDIFWKQSDLTEAELGAYAAYINEKVQSLASRYPEHSFFEALCPLCENSVPVLEFTGSIRCAECPRCKDPSYRSLNILFKLYMYKPALAEMG